VLPDPVARAIEGLMDQVSRLQARIAVLEGELNGKAARSGSENGAATELGADSDEARRSDVAAE